MAESKREGDGAPRRMAIEEKAFYAGDISGASQSCNLRVDRVDISAQSRLVDFKLLREALNPIAKFASQRPIAQFCRQDDAGEEDNRRP